MLTYMCLKCKREEKVEVKTVLHCDYCFVPMVPKKIKEKMSGEGIDLKEIVKVAESENTSGKLVEIQDKTTQKVIKDCPQYAGTIDFLAQLGGEG